MAKQQLPYQEFILIRQQIESKVLENCPVNLLRIALKKMQVTLREILHDFVTRKIIKSSMDLSCIKVLKKCLPYVDISFLFSIGFLIDYLKKPLLLDPYFWQVVPQNFQNDVSLVINILTLRSENDFAILVPLLRRYGLPIYLKHELVLDTPFSSYFHLYHMPNLIKLHSLRAISDEDMFFLAIKLPHTNFLELLPKCLMDVHGLQATIYFEDQSNTIQGHILEICNMEQNGDNVGEYLSVFLNSAPQQVIGEGQFIHYLALWVPILFQGQPQIIDQVFSRLPAVFIKCIVEVIDDTYLKCLLKPHFEFVFTRNLLLFSPRVRQLLFTNLQMWFPIKKDLIEHVKSLWESPICDFNDAVETLSNTKNLLILFNNKFQDFSRMCSQLEGLPDRLNIQSVYTEYEQIYKRLQPLLRSIDEVSTTSLEDVLTGEILEGDIYCIGDNLYISSKTKDVIQFNPFTRESLDNEEIKNKKVTPITERKKEWLDLEKKKIIKQINEIRKLISLT
jgi:hypothetical protein